MPHAAPRGNLILVAHVGSGGLRVAFRVLTFRVTRDELCALDRRHLALGLVLTWIVGMGRYWDDPGAHFVQHLGVGSVIYVFGLSALLWGAFKPLGAADWTYRRVLTFVTLTAPPAILYAIPVERFVDLAAARTINVWFLAVVASWRVALFVFFARRLGRLSYPSVLVGTVLPLTLIVSTLTFLNLERAVFDIMGGLREGEGTENDAAYQILFVLTFLSMIAFPILAVAWSVVAAMSYRAKRKGKAGAAP